MPADRLFLTYFDQGLNALRTIGMATPETAECLDAVVQLETTDDIAGAVRQLPRDGIFNSLEANPFNKAMADFYGMGHEAHSLMQMFMETEDKKSGIGHLTLAAKGENRYTPDHLTLLKYLRAPLSIASANALQHMRHRQYSEKLDDDNRFFQKELLHRSGDTLIGADAGLKQVMHHVQQVARKNSTVLLLGPTGTGKDVVANAIHQLSQRRSGPFIKVNCGAIADTLIDSELFGHEKGAFSGASTQTRGRFERADQGTIFLDEIAELPLGVQARLLRVLQSKEFERVGGSRTITIDTRIIAATHRNLEQLVSQGKFREDLWFRLNIFPITLPPLKERKADIPALVHYMIKKKCGELQLPMVPELMPNTIIHLMAYHWPGNVRELENVVERALILHQQGPLNLTPFIRQSDASPVRQEDGGITPFSLKLDDCIIWQIERALNLSQGKISGPSGAAQMLGINAGTLRNKMKKLGILYGRRRKPLYEVK